jgi:hypothetical protein
MPYFETSTSVIRLPLGWEVDTSTYRLQEKVTRGKHDENFINFWPNSLVTFLNVSRPSNILKLQVNLACLTSMCGVLCRKYIARASGHQERNNLTSSII